MTPAIGVRRILVALEAGPESAAALDRAARLAAEMQAELAGLLIQDEGLLRLCELPVWEVSLGSGARRRPDRQTLEWELRAQAAEMRRRMEAAALRRQLVWSFQVARGRGPAAVRGAAVEAELLILGARRRAGRQAAAVPAPVVAIYEGGEGGARVLDIAVRVARDAGAPVLVLLPAGSIGEADAEKAEADRLLRQSGVMRALAVVPLDPEALTAAVEAAGCRLVVLQDEGAASGEALDRLLEAAGCDAVLVRTARG